MKDLFGLETLGTTKYIISIIVVFITLLGSLLFYCYIIKFIVNSIKMIRIHKFFKSNVVRCMPNNEQAVDANNQRKDVYKDVSKNKLEMFNTDNINSLKDYFYNLFLNFENAYNNLDYNMMKMLSTKQLFQNYYTGITLDLKAGQKKIINNIERQNVVIYELDSTIAKQTLSAMIEISYITYTINKDGYVISGSRDNSVVEKFDVTFRKDFEKEDVTKCPSCGANIVGNKCDFCRTTIRNIDFKISSIKRIIDE